MVVQKPAAPEPDHMNEPTPLPRRYGDKEIGRILKRATELQHATPTAPGTGVTLSELVEIAAEAGIDPAFLRRAAVEVDAGVDDPSMWGRVLGGELIITRETTLPGELPADGFEDIVGVLQGTTRLHGQPSMLGRTLTWRAETPSKTRTTQIVVTSRDDMTNIRLEENLGQLASGLFAGGTTGVGVGLGLGVGLPLALNVLGSTALAVAAPLGAVGLSFLGCRAIYRAITQKRRLANDELFERIVDAAQSSIAAATLPSSRRPTASLPPG
jgi:hypothetical protein